MFKLLSNQSYQIPSFVWKNRKDTLIIVGCTSIATLVMTLFSYNYWSNWGRKLTERKLPDVTEVLFFTEKYSLCYEHNEYNTPCDSSDCGLEKLK